MGRAKTVTPLDARLQAAPSVTGGARHGSNSIRQRRYSALPLSLPPRGLSREAAADYIGISATKFDEMVRDGRMPKPKEIDSRRVWDRTALDKAFDRLPGNDGEENPWDAVA